MVKNKFKVKSKVWLYGGGKPGEHKGVWHFISVPKKQAAEIKSKFGHNRRGFNSLRVSVTIGKTTWKTSIFPDSKSGEYLLPLKADVREKEDINQGDTVNFQIEILA